MFEALCDIGSFGDMNNDLVYSLGFDIVATLFQPNISFPGELSLSNLRSGIELSEEEKVAIKEVFI